MEQRRRKFEKRWERERLLKSSACGENSCIAMMNMTLWLADRLISTDEAMMVVRVLRRDVFAMMVLMMKFRDQILQQVLPSVAPLTQT